MNHLKTGSFCRGFYTRHDPKVKIYGTEIASIALLLKGLALSSFLAISSISTSCLYCTDVWGKIASPAVTSLSADESFQIYAFNIQNTMTPRDVYDP